MGTRTKSRASMRCATPDCPYMNESRKYDRCDRCRANERYHFYHPDGYTHLSLWISKVRLKAGRWLGKGSFMEGIRTDAQIKKKISLGKRKHL